jgi:hypothetical protein
MTLCADLNSDGVVNFLDLGLFRSQFGDKAVESEFCPAVSTIEVELTSPVMSISGEPISGLVSLRIVRTADGCWKALLADEAGRESEAVIACQPNPP